MNRCAVMGGLCALAGSPAFAQVDRVTCGSDLEGLDNVELQLLFDAGIYDPPVAPLGAWEIPITFHVVRRSNGTGGTSQGQINQALDDLNDAFADAGMVFCQMGPIQYIDSDAFYFDIDTDDEIIELKQTDPVPGTINVYTTENLANDDFDLCGDSSFTWFGTQGIAMWNGCFGIPGNLRFAHEVGHYFNLLHTHEVACCNCIQGTCAECTSGSNCACCGDRICDTPADPLLWDLDNNVFLVENCQYTGDADPPCPNDPPYDPDVSNIMAYAPIECLEAFTPQQDDRMVATLVNERDDLITTDCAYAGTCGAGAGPCPEPHGGTGCLDAACCTIVCDDDPSCCDVAWDMDCALLAQDICDLGPDNDDCQDAKPVSANAQLVHFDTTYADTDGPAHPECSFDDDQVNSDVWYHYEAPCTGDLTLSICDDATFDTRIAAYRNLNCPVSFIDLLGCNDDGPGCTGGTSELTLYVILGDLLTIRVGGAGFEQGTGTLHFNCKTQFDDCDAALALFGYEGPINVNTIGAEQDGPIFCGTHNDVWIDYHPACTGFLQIETQADFNMGFAVYDNCGCPANMDDQIACNVGAFVEANQCYKVQVGGFGANEEGTGQITFTCMPSPDNDNCANAAAIGPGDTANFDTSSASTDGPALADPCAGGNPLDNQVWFDLWYAFTAPCDATLTASTCGQVDFDTRVAIYEGCACPITDDDLLVCSDDAAGCGTASEATADVVDGQCYLIRVGGASAQSGTGQLSIDLEPDCQGDANGDGIINVTDFLIILSTWGACPPPCPPSCPADFDGDCSVGVTDFLILLANWT